MLDIRVMHVMKTHMLRADLLDDPVVQPAKSVRIPVSPVRGDGNKYGFAGCLSCSSIRSFTVSSGKKCKNPTSQSFTSRYILYEKQGPERNSYAYGLLRQERHADRWVTVAITAPFSNNKPSLMQFAAHCTESQLNSIHLLDALHDFMDAEARTH